MLLMGVRLYVSIHLGKGPCYIIKHQPHIFKKCVTRAYISFCLQHKIFIFVMGFVGLKICLSVCRYVCLSLCSQLIKNACKLGNTLNIPIHISIRILCHFQFSALPGKTLVVVISGYHQHIPCH